MTWVCSLTITDAMSSAWPKKSRPRPAKKALDRPRSLTGRLTKSLVAMGAPSLVNDHHGRLPVCAARSALALTLAASRLTVLARQFSAGQARPHGDTQPARPGPARPAGRFSDGRGQARTA